MRTLQNLVFVAVSTTLTSYYTCPSNTKVTVREISAVRNSGTDPVLFIYLRQGSTDRLIFAEPIKENFPVIQERNLVLNAGDQLKMSVNAGTNPVHVVITGIVQTPV